MRALLIHNPSAGEGAHTKKWLRDSLARAGYTVTYCMARQRDFLDLLNAPTDLVIVAGGDGAIDAVVSSVPRRGAPIAILPLGTANNIAKSLGLDSASEAMMARWRLQKLRPIHRIIAEGPWGSRIILEGIGFGALEQAIEKAADQKLGLGEARDLLRHMIEQGAPVTLEARIDGTAGEKAIRGSFAIFEVMNFPLLGPNLCLAPGTDPSDRLLDICMVAEGRSEREAFIDWLAETPCERQPGTRRHAEYIAITGQFEQFRLNDKLWQNTEASGRLDTITLRTEEEPVYFLA